MKTKEISTVSPATLKALLRGIPFYKAVKKQSNEQFDLLMSFSKIFQFNSNEKVLSRGDLDSWVYFVVKGQLIVSAPDSDGLDHPVNYITPGEVFGDVSVYLKSARTADVIVDSNSKEAILFGTDFSFFGDLLEFHLVSLETKLLYYRQANHSLRWKLEMYRSKYPKHPLADQHRSITLYNGIKESEFELKALYQQTADLAKLLVQWNQSSGSLSLADGVIPSPDLDFDV